MIDFPDWRPTFRDDCKRRETVCKSHRQFIIRVREWNSIRGNPAHTHIGIE
jgi:hypothetical protein